MRSVAIILLVLVSTFSKAQDWRDSLSAAHSAYAEGKYKEAHDKFISAQRLAPEDIDLSKDIGTSAYRNGDYESAEKAFQSAVNKSETTQESARKWHNIGNAQMKQKNYSKAIDSYKQALRDNPNDDKTRYNLSEAKRRLKKQQEEQQKQNQNSDNQDQNEQNQQGQGQDQNQKNSSDQNNQSNPSDKEGQQNQNSQNGQPSSSEEQKLSSKKTERMLDELMKKEMETKRRVHGLGSGGQQEQVKSGKRW
jgi:tetratricopeptide (TPR) repeat protein